MIRRTRATIVLGPWLLIVFGCVSHRGRVGVEVGLAGVRAGREQGVDAGHLAPPDANLVPSSIAEPLREWLESQVLDVLLRSPVVVAFAVATLALGLATLLAVVKAKRPCCFQHTPYGRNNRGGGATLRRRTARA